MNIVAKKQSVAVDFFIKLMHDNYNALEIEIMLSVCLSFDERDERGKTL
jgi:hypothetical protein